MGKEACTIAVQNKIKSRIEKENRYKYIQLIILLEKITTAILLNLNIVPTIYFVISTIILTALSFYLYYLHKMSQKDILIKKESHLLKYSKYGLIIIFLIAILVKYL